MLNVPETVKALFKQDGIRKNFRVHFPDGELPDITNDNIVQESVRFTESICSQDVLKFGLTEAAVIEFETVGVANMYGMWIECGIEIDLSSLTAAQLSDIAAGTWDGTYVASGDSDLGYAYFRVPYGVFRVESCPRDHQAMTHRKVEAYSPSANLEISEIEQLKLQTGSIKNKTYNPSLHNLFYSLVSDEDMMLENGYSKVEITPTFNVTDSSMRQFGIPVTDAQPGKTPIISPRGGTYYGIVIELYGNTRNFVPGKNSSWTYGVPKDAMFSLEVGGVINWIEDVSEYLAESLLIDYDNFETYTGYSTLTELVAHYASVFNPAIFFAPTYYTSSGVNYPLNAQRLELNEKTGIFYPYLNEEQIMSIALPKRIEVYERGSGGSTVDSRIFDFSTLYGDELKLYEYRSDVSNISAQFAATAQRKYTLNTKTYLINTFIDSFDKISFIQGFLELTAQFGKVNRFGAFELIRISKDVLVPILSTQYSQFWWDEYDVLPIGSVKYSYTGENNENNLLIYQFGSGASIYDMSENEALKAISEASEEDINALLDSSFIPYLAPINFTPIDLEMKGLPYMEARDYLAVTAEDGVTAYSFNMRQEISGIQALTANIESTSGDIIESGDANE